MSNLLLFPLHDEQQEDAPEDGVASQLPSLESRLIRASAGTGKTYQLTSRYLELLLRGAAPESILATTFTRKAAGEILDRIIVRLAEAARNDKSLAQLAEAVDLPLLSTKDCQDKLMLLTRQMHRLRIYTLDAFFMQLAMSFSLELGLTPGWQILQDGAEISTLKSQAVADVLRAEKLEDLLTLVHQLSPKGQAKRSLGAMLESQVSAAYDLFLDAEPDAWDKIKPPAPLPLDELQEIAHELRALPLKNKQIPRARDLDVDRIHAEDWRGFFDGTTLVKNIMEGKTKYGSAKLPEELIALYQRFLVHLQAKILQSAAAQTRGTRAFLEKYHQHFQQRKVQQRLHEFSDVTRMLAEHARQQDLTALTYRLDAGIDHLLLDEFQDTSIPQWQALLPLAQRATSGEVNRSFFCVGDVKQAIYGWRGATSEIFDLLDDRLPNLTQLDLQQSRRSAPVIIETVNRVFDFLPQWEKLKRAKRGAAAWDFPPHTTVHQNMPGYVTLETAEAGEEFDRQGQENMVFQCAASRVATMVQQAPGRTIGILCRTNREVGRMMHELQREGVSASEEGGNFLTDSAAVELVLSLLQLADHPSDSIAAYHLASSPWRSSLGLEVNACSVDAAATGNPESQPALPSDAPRKPPPAGIDPKAIRRLARRVRGQLQDDGFGETLQNWAQQLRPACNPRESKRLSQLVEKAYEYQNQLETARQLGYQRQRRTSTRATEFVRFVRETKVSDPSADAVRVMTVHQAKGLQFDAVVLPDLLGPLVGTNDTFLYRRPSIDRPIDLVCRYMGKDSGRAFLPGEFQPLFDEHEDRKARESLCVLYVAMTRAVHALHMVIPAALHSVGAKENPAQLLKNALAGDGKVEPATTLLEYGDENWFDNMPGATDPLTAEQASPVAPTPSLATKVDRRRYLETISPSQVGASRQVRLAERLAPGGEEAKEIGSLVHRWLSEITWLNSPDDLPPDDRLRALAGSLADSTIVESALGRFGSLLTSATLTDVLTKERYLVGLRGRLPGLAEDVQLEVRTEQPVAGRDDGGIVTGMVDRLVIVRVHDRILAADIMDYKIDLSGQQVANVAASKSAQYQRQLAAYRQMIAAGLQLPSNQISSQLVFL